MVVRARPYRRPAERGRPGKALEPPTVVLAEDRQKRQDEVGLRERRSARVDPQEDLGDALLVDLMANLNRLERIVLQCAKAAKSTAELSSRHRSQAPQASHAQPIDERVDDLPVLAGPEFSDVGEELGILLNGRVGDLKSCVARPKGELDSAR